MHPATVSEDLVNDPLLADVLAAPEELHYNYNLQVWVTDGIIPDCEHPAAMKARGCCNSHRFRGLTEGQAAGEVEWERTRPLPS